MAAGGATGRMPTTLKPGRGTRAARSIALRTFFKKPLDNSPSLPEDMRASTRFALQRGE